MDRKLVLFAYDFPHRKTQDFLLRLSTYGCKPALVVASPHVALGFPPTDLRDKVRHIDLLPVRELCEACDIEYLQMAHDNDQLPTELQRRGIEHGIIAGARILKRPVLDAVPGGILNFHPGLIPYNRGLHTAKWAVKFDIPQGITAHIVDRRVDAGRTLGLYMVDILPDDDLRDINLRLYEAQLCVLLDSLGALLSGEPGESFVGDEYPKHPPADLQIDAEVRALWPSYRERFSSSIEVGLHALGINPAHVERWGPLYRILHLGERPAIEGAPN